VEKVVSYGQIGRNINFLRKKIFFENFDFLAWSPLMAENLKISKVSNFSKNDMYPLSFMRKSRKSSSIRDLKFLSTLKM